MYRSIIATIIRYFIITRTKNVSVYFICADDGIGKFDRSMLSQKNSMELFTFGLAKTECGNREVPNDACK